MTVPISILSMDSEGARSLFLKGASYCNFELPAYFAFDPILSEVNSLLEAHDLRCLQDLPRGGFKVIEGVNHVVLNNKDGRLSWRPMSLINPVIYVDLVHVITNESNWRFLLNRFKRFARNDRIQCLSLPLVSQSSRSSKAEQILAWWRDIEQSSIALSLQYPYVAQTDIADCYGSIYTHSVAWAIHGKSAMKRMGLQDYKGTLGGKLDTRLQDMSQGQTNGIPQGSILMDFIAELVLGYADLAISISLSRQKIEKYRILRYRDDYRIFSESPVVCEAILKAISEVHQSLGMKINSAKTFVSDNVVGTSVKPDKLAWIVAAPRQANMHKQLLAIHSYAQKFPNSGALVRALSEFHKKAQRRNWKSDNILPSIAIVADIAVQNPKTYAMASAIMSRLLQFADPEQRIVIIRQLHARFERIANTGHLQIWLQRLSHPYLQDIPYAEPLCRLVKGDNVEIWNNSWISSRQLKEAVNPSLAINRDVLSAMTPTISSAEVQLFTGYSS